MADYFALGSYTRRVTTGSDRAQTWFTRGLLWAYGFNHEEAAACFERAAEADPGCVMAYWGLAYALGPNYNKPWEAFGPEEASSSLSRAAAALTAAAGRAVRRRAAEPHPVGAVGPGDRRAGPGRGRGGGQGRAGTRPGRPGWPGAPGHPAYVHTPDGDVCPARGCAACG